MAKKSATNESQEAPPPSFEDSMDALEQAVRQLEEGRLGLSDSLKCYENGVKHLKQCYQSLEAAERKIELLAGVDAEGNPISEPFDEGEMTLDEKATARGKRRSRKRPDDSGPPASGSLF